MTWEGSALDKEPQSLFHGFDTQRTFIARREHNSNSEQDRQHSICPAEYQVDASGRNPDRQKLAHDLIRKIVAGIAEQRPEIAQDVDQRCRHAACQERLAYIVVTRYTAPKKTCEEAGIRGIARTSI